MPPSETVHEPATVADVLGSENAPKLGDPVPNFTGHQPFGPSGIHVVGVGDLPVNPDRKGTPFDPERHLPVKHPRTGCWMPRRKPAVAAGSPGAAMPPPPADPAPDLSDIASAARGTPPPVLDGAGGETGENATVAGIIGLVQMILVYAGEEEGVLKPAERFLLADWLKRICAKYSIGNDIFPVELEGLLILGGIIIERIKLGKKTATTFAKVKAWFTAKFFQHKGATMGRTMRDAVPADIVARMEAEVQRLRSELDAARAVPAAATVPGGGA